VTAEPRMGRPPISDCCVDCFRAGRSPEDSGEKKYGSYCGEHYYKRMKASKILKSCRKEVVHGFWSELSDEQAETHADRCNENVAKTMKKLDNKRRALAAAFEWRCMEIACINQRRLTRAEEDAIIEAFGGSRQGVPAIGPVGPEGRVEPVGPVLLPDPDVRRLHRAGLFGGPTTEGEPDLEVYYEQHKHRPLPADLQILDKNEVIASDGMKMHKDFIGEYEAMLKRGITPVEITADMDEHAIRRAVQKAKPRDDSAYEEEGVPPDVNLSISQMMQDD